MTTITLRDIYQRKSSGVTNERYTYHESDVTYTVRDVMPAKAVGIYLVDFGDGWITALNGDTLLEVQS